MLLEQRIIETGGRSSGFDYLRIGLAVSVIVWHAFGISYGMAYAKAAALSPAGPLVALIVPSFFALSGFLVAGSLKRSKALSTFLGLRIIRIFPALCVEVVLSAMILGPILTRVPLAEYFGAHSFRAYFLNILGDMHYELPGLFTTNPIPLTVNGQLWTVPGELKCYLAATLLTIVTIIRRRLLLVGIVLIGCVALWLRHTSGAPAIANEAVSMPGGLLVMFFLAAWCVHSYRDVLPWNGWGFIVCFVLSVLFALNQNTIYLMPFPVAYATVYVGLTNFPKIFLIRGADYSYGMYLYGFVIQQSVANIGPVMHHWYLNILVSIPVAGAFAAGSWNLVERPAMKLRQYLPRLEQFFDRQGRRLWRRA